MSRTVAVIGHAAELGGAELSLIRSLRTLPEGHRPVRMLWLAEGAVATELRTLGLPVDVIPLDERLLSTDRFAAAGKGLVGRVARSSRTAVSVARWLRAHDVGLVMTTSMKSLAVGTLGAWLARKPVAWWVHDRVSPDYLPLPLVRLLRSAARHVPHTVVVNSMATAATLPGARRMVVAHPGYAGYQARETPRPRPDGAPVVGLVGRISPTKGQLEFVRAAATVLASHPDATFRIIGAPMFGADGYAESVHSEIRALGIEDRVDVVGFVRGTAAELDGMTLCAHTSPVPEPFGNVVVEAMVRGVPVVATEGGGVPEILHPEGGPPLGLLVPPGDVAALATAIVAVLDDPAAAEARAALAHASAIARFPAERTMDVVSLVWDDVLGAVPGHDARARSWPDDAAYRPPRAVAWVDGQAMEGGVAPVRVARLPDGPINVLDGSAAVVWRAATSSPRGSWVEAVAEELHGQAEDLRPQVEDFVASLVASGLLEVNEPASG